MFTGIIRIIGTVQWGEWRAKGLRLVVVPNAPLNRVVVGSSVSMNGACLTVVDKKGKMLAFDVVSETVRRTTLGSLKKGDRVNLEPSLRVGDEIGGHLVLGHIDGVGVISNKDPLPRKGEDRGEGAKEVLMVVRASRKLMKFIAEKGSIAVDGVSLTVAAVKGSTFIVALVPYTLKHTTLGKLKTGTKVNIEVDVVARYLHRLSSHT